MANIAVVKSNISFPKTKKGRKRKYNIYVLIKHIILNPKKKQSQNEDMYYIYHAREKEGRLRKKQKRM